jgi:eukaryotic-like serine/threonine-protein kinase
MTLNPNEPQRLGPYDLRSKFYDDGSVVHYRAVDRNTGADVAVRVSKRANGGWPRRFEREFHAWPALDHPNVVRALDFSGAPPHPYLVTEYVNGVEIGQWIESRGDIPEPIALGLIAQVCHGLQHAHSHGALHRDITPSNVLVSCEGVAKLTGFYFLSENDANEFDRGRGWGAPRYLAPELFRDIRTADARGDIYSLGATLYAMVTGGVPFANDSPIDCWMKKVRNDFPAPRELNSTVSERVDWAIRRAMSGDPSERPGSCREFFTDLTGRAG